MEKSMPSRQRWEKERTEKGLTWIQSGYVEMWVLELGVVGLASVVVMRWQVEGISPFGII